MKVEKIPVTYPTKFAQLGYMEFALNCRIVDLTTKKFVGPLYATTKELMRDLPRFHAEYTAKFKALPPAPAAPAAPADDLSALVAKLNANQERMTAAVARLAVLSEQLAPPWLLKLTLDARMRTLPVCPPASGIAYLNLTDAEVSALRLILDHLKWPPLDTGEMRATHEALCSVQQKLNPPGRNGGEPKTGLNLVSR